MILSPFARADLREIEDYIAGDSPRAARRFVDALLSRIDRLEPGAHGYGRHPSVGPPLRRVLYCRYAIFFEVFEDEVLVVGVLHGSRDLAAILEGRRR